MDGSAGRRSFTFLIAVGVVSGVAWQLNQLSAKSEDVSVSQAWIGILLGAAIMPLLFHATTLVASRLLTYLSLPADTIGRYLHLSRYSFAVFLVFLLGANGLAFSLTLVVIVSSVWVFIQVILVIYAVEKRAHARTPKSLQRITFLFLISGMAALLYQIVWQRVLFTSFGVNIESITIVVSIFMFGLGVGSLVGGRLSARYSNALPLLFVVCEFAIGLFGLASIPLIRYVSDLAVQLPVPMIGLTVYGLLMIPTLFMGATLPILVKYLHSHYGHVGRAVGDLYWLNTMGSAFACFLTVDLLFRIGGLQSTIWVAVILNLLVGSMVYFYSLQDAPGDVKGRF